MASQILNKSQIAQLTDLVGKLLAGVRDHWAEFDDQASARCEPLVRLRQQPFDDLRSVFARDQRRFRFVIPDGGIELSVLRFTHVWRIATDEIELLRLSDLRQQIAVDESDAFIHSMFFRVPFRDF